MHTYIFFISSRNGYITNNYRQKHGRQNDKTLKTLLQISFIRKTYMVATKSSHYHESPLNRIKTRRLGYIFINLDLKMSNRM